MQESYPRLTFSSLHLPKWTKRYKLRQAELKATPKQWLSLLLPVALFGLLFFLSEYGIQIEKARLNEVERSQVLQESASVRARLESELNATLHLTTGLTGYIVINPELNDANKVKKVLGTLFQYGHHLRNVGLAPGNIITYIYPEEGNEKAIGLHYKQHPRQWPAVKRAIETHSTVLAGPLNLVQGGRGIISRTPVFLDDDHYWGILSLVIDVDSLFTDAGLSTEGDNGNVEFAMRGKDGLGGSGGLFFGNAAVFQQSPIMLDLTVPGGQWQLAAIPKGGWGSHQAGLEYVRLIGLLISLSLTVLVWMNLNDRRKIKYLALHDPLTGLPNRRLFDERLNYTLLQKQRQKRPFSLLYIDLDNFKPINDHYGHKVGDLVLKKIASRMLNTVRHEDTVARIGGDEFMIILPSTGNQKNTMLVTREILDAISQPFVHQGESLEINTSIGISIYPQSGNTGEELIRAADHAMYRAKKGGKRRICYDRDDRQESNTFQPTLIKEAQASRATKQPR